tara:strand:+ start:118 stop:654 length:537 start_codon:yes stop_codon:yes gene_type:complete
MDSIIEAKKKQTETIYDLLKDCKISNEDHKSSKEPFFLMDISKKFKVGFKDIPELPSSLNRHFKLFYEIVSNPKIEVYIGEWIMMSLNEVLENYKQLCSKGQETVFDIGYRYKGMGHIEVLSCNLYNHLLFYRMDGGSNDWDREANYKNIINFNYKEYQYFYFTDWLSQVNQVNQFNQ